MSIKRWKTAFRGRISDGPHLRTPSGLTCVNFQVAYNLHDRGNNVRFIKCTAWDNPKTGSQLATFIAENFAVGDYIGIEESRPYADTALCPCGCNGKVPVVGFTVYAISGCEEKGLPEDVPEAESTFVIDTGDGEIIY